MEIKLRDYQEKVYKDIRMSFLKGAKGVCAVLPCRSGKSFVIAKISQDACKKGSHVLILAHRNTLINQHKELFEELELKNKNIRIESVFTEVNHLGENGPVDLIIIDEGHLSGAASYQKVCSYYNCLRILFTATASRLDGKPLSLADTMVVGITAKELIKKGNISDFSYYAPDLDINFSQVKKTAGDYNNQQLGQVMGTKKIYGDVLKYYNMLAKGKQAIAYCVNVQHSQEVCEMFNNEGISARHMDSHTPEKERERLLQEFKRGEFKILCNCNLISEGITLPSAEVGLLLRPTLSLVLYIQQAMRCLTPNGNKKAIIIDYVNNVQRHGLPTMDRDWSLDTTVKEYDNENEDGTLKIRVCQECFSAFLQAPVCPYCGAVYQTTDVEIQNFKQIELKKIEEAKEAKRQKYLRAIEDKVSTYESAKDCKNWVELTQWVRQNGYKPRLCVYTCKTNENAIWEREIRMKEIIFWFSSHKIRNYWFDYALNSLERYTVPPKYNKLESWIDFLNLRILFKVNYREEADLAGHWDKNQYWVEELFDNNFEEFFFTFIFANKPFEEMK